MNYCNFVYLEMSLRITLEFHGNKERNIVLARTTTRKYSPRTQ